ncbi:MAG: DCC1-like thiol-disulfide oxidoreductase family protein [Phycisphaerales bacterium]
MEDDHPIVFYDGACGLCDRSVRWIMDRDRAHAFRFAPLQGETFAGLQRDDVPADMSTLVVLIDGDVLVRSDAVLAIWRTLGGVWSLFAGIGRIVPRALRDALYRLIARHRLKLFGGAEACRLPTRTDRARMLP